MKWKIIIQVLQYIVLFAIFALTLNATEGTIKSVISGRVVDVTTQQPLPGTNVWLLNTKLGAITDYEGNYTIENVPCGRYSITARMIGYKQVTNTNIVVVPKRTTISDFELKYSPIEMPEIVVKPEYFEKDITEEVTSTTTIDKQEIASTPGIPDVFRRLQSVAGVVRTSDRSPFLVVRGGSPDENLTLLENIEIYSPYHLASLGDRLEAGLSIIDPKLINELKLNTGGFSSQYGDKLSSVTLINLRQPEKRRITGDAYLDVAGVGGFFTGPLGSKVSWMVSARRGIYEILMKMQGKSNFPSTTDILSKVLYEPVIQHKFTFSGVYVQDDMTVIRDEDSLYAGFKKNSTIYKKINSLGITWRYLYSNKGFLSVTPFINLNDWSMETGPDEDIDKVGTENRENYYGARTKLTYQFSKKHNCVIGGEFKLVKTEYATWCGVDTLKTGEIIEPYNIEFGPEESFKAASFIQYSLEPYNWSRLNLGLRYDYFDFTQDAVISPRLCISFDLSEKVRLNFAYGLYAQFPPFYDIFLDPTNVNLKTSEATHYILGAEYLLTSDLQLKVEGYYKDLKNLAVCETDTSKVYESTGFGYSKGVEFTLTKRMGDNLYVLANYTYSESRRTNDEDMEEYDSDFDSPHMANIMTTYKLGDWWEFGLTYSYSTGLPYTPYDLSTRRQIGELWVCDKGDVNSERLPDYHRLDVRVDRRFVFMAWNLSTYLEVWNLTNHENVVEYNYSENFTEKIAKTTFPIMPIIGLAAEF